MKLENIGSYYQKIGEKLIELALLDWKKIYFYFEIGNGWNSRYYIIQDMNGKYIGESELRKQYNLEESVKESIFNEIKVILNDLKKTFHNETGDNWSSITVILSEDGKCNIDYQYENLDEDERDTYERILLWRKKYLKTSNRGE